MELPSFPRSLTLALSDRCNLRCRHCRYGEPRKHEPARMDVESFAAVVRDLASVRRDFVVQLSGGEPLLFSGLERLVEKISGLGVRNLINTNGILLSRERIRDLSQAGLQEVVISLDGFRVIHDYIRRKRGAFRRAMEAVDLVRSLAPHIKVAVLSVISAYNLDQLVAFTQWLQEDQRIDGILFQFITQPMPALTDHEWFLHSDLWPQDPGEAALVLDQLIAMRETKGSKILNPSSQLTLMKRYFADPNNCIQTTCNVDFRYITVDVTGHMRSCIEMPPLIRLDGHNMVTVLASAEALEYIRAMRSCRRNCHFLINCAYEEAGAEQGQEEIKDV